MTEQIQQAEPHPTDTRLAEIRQVCGSMVKTVQRALPSGSKTDPETFCQIAMTALIAQLSETVTDAKRNNVRDIDGYVRDKALIFCSENSLRRVIAQAAELDLQPGSALGYCWFIRRGDSATFMVGVNGFTQLLLRHPDVAKVHADVIFEADRFRVVRGENPRLEHEPAWMKQPHKPTSDGGRGERIGAYAVLTFTSGMTDFCLMNQWDLMRAQAQGRANNTPAYRDWPEEMDQRSAIKRGQKRWPKSLELQRALEFDRSDEAAESGDDDAPTITTSGETSPASATPPVPKQRAALDGITREMNGRQPNTADSFSSRAHDSATVGK